MKNIVFNNSIGSPYSFGYPNLTKEQETNILAGLFEQLLIFDKVVISTNRVNAALIFLIKNLGINIVEQLIEKGYIKFMIWSPGIMTGTHRLSEDGTVDKSVIYEQPPIVASSLSEDDLDPEKNIHTALINFDIHKDRQRIFTRKASKNYIIPNGMVHSSRAVDTVIEAYKNNTLSTLGLPYLKEPNDLDIKERLLLNTLGHKALETIILSKYKLKSYENYEHYEICKQNLRNIGRAYNISEGTSTLLKLKGLPDLKELFIKRNIQFERVFTIRHLPSAKYYRKWINEIGETSDAQEITKEYLNEIESKNFFETSVGKFLKDRSLFILSALLENAIADTPGIITGVGVEIALSFLDNCWLDSILEGQKPSMFINEIEKEVR
jgi:hypothetical protein